MRASIEYYASQPRVVVTRRIRELEREWGVERALEIGASALALTGVALGVARSKRWLLFSGGVIALLLQRAMQGWRPPADLLRLLGVRSQNEIDRERYALKYLRGDFFGSGRGESPIEEACALAATISQSER